MNGDKRKRERKVRERIGKKWGKREGSQRYPLPVDSPANSSSRLPVLVTSYLPGCLSYLFSCFL